MKNQVNFEPYFFKVNTTIKHQSMLDGKETLALTVNSFSLDLNS